MTVLKVKRVNRGRNHHYIDETTGARLPGVTTIIGKGIPKPALIGWAGKTTAEYALDHWDDLAAMPPSERLKAMTKAPNAARDGAAVRGTRVHALADRLTFGDEVTVPAELAGHVKAYAQFLDDFDVQPVQSEAVVYSVTNRHVGTLDLIADLLFPEMPEYDHLPRTPAGFVRCLLDIKTSKSGVYGEHAVQLAGYRYSEWLLDAPGAEPIPMPVVSWVGVVHVTAAGYQLVPVECGPEQYEVFLHAQRIAEFADTARDLVGEPVPPPDRDDQADPAFTQLDDAEVPF